MSEAMKKPQIHRLELFLDDADVDAIGQAIAYRKTFPMPDFDGSLAGAAVAEICRGWLDMMGQWKWSGNPKGKVAREVKERGGRKKALRIRKVEQGEPT